MVRAAMPTHRMPVAFTAAALALAACTGPPAPREAPLLCVATWPFGKLATERAREVLRAGGSALDAVEQGIRVVEAASSDGSVGLGGHPNAAGWVQLDACIMDGIGHRAGSVAGLEGIVHPISVARRVMERTKHVMLVGEGARWFALEQGIEAVDVAGLAAKKQAWVDGAAKRGGRELPREGHDTIALLVLREDGTIAGGCSTSGAGNKLPGRVGDSPILGSGLYVDGEVGAAGATGTGENVMRWCASFLIVELMRQGLHPQQACEEVLHRIARADPRGYGLDVCFVALDKRGRHGAAASGMTFPFAVTTAESSAVLTVPAVERR